MKHIIEQNISDKVLHWFTAYCQENQRRLQDITVSFMSDEELLEYNLQLLNHDFYTDIITVDRCRGKRVSGDLLISLERVKENATTQQVEYSVELARVVAHGLWHLLGYKDKTEAEAAQMRTQEELVLKSLGYVE